MSLSSDLRDAKASLPQVKMSVLTPVAMKVRAAAIRIRSTKKAMPRDSSSERCCLHQPHTTVGLLAAAAPRGLLAACIKHLGRPQLGSSPKRQL